MDQEFASKTKQFCLLLQDYPVVVKTDSTELDVIAGAIYSSLGRIASQQAAQVAQAAK